MRKEGEMNVDENYRNRIPVTIPPEETGVEGGVLSNGMTMDIKPASEIAFAEETSIAQETTLRARQQEFAYINSFLDKKRKALDIAQNNPRSAHEMNGLQAEIQKLEQAKQEIGLAKELEEKIIDQLDHTAVNMQKIAKDFPHLPLENQIAVLQTLDAQSNGLSNLAPLFLAIDKKQISKLDMAHVTPLFHLAKSAEIQLHGRNALQREILGRKSLSTGKERNIIDIIGAIVSKLSDRLTDMRLDYSAKLEEAKTRHFNKGEMEKFMDTSISQQIKYLEKMRQLYPQRDFTQLLTAGLNLNAIKLFGQDPLETQIDDLKLFLSSFPERLSAAQLYIEALNAKELEQGISDLPQRSLDTLRNIIDTLEKHHGSIQTDSKFGYIKKHVMAELEIRNISSAA